ncbi:MAG: restriction endonuclease subunit S, partial [Bacillota bacterium]
MQEEIKERLDKMQSGEVPYGYKKIGKSIVSNDWANFKLGDKAYVTKLAGFEFTDHVNYIEDGEIIALRALNVKNGRLALTDVKYINKKVSENLERSKLYIDDIVFTYIGTIGEVALIKENDKYHLAPNIAKIVFNKNELPEYYLQYFLSDLMKKEIYKLLTTTSQPALSMGNIREIQIFAPKNGREQHKIVTILSVWDKAIELKEYLIEKKKVQKEGLLKKILTGEVRLPGFEGEWKEVQLSEISRQITLKNLSCTKHEGLVDSLEYFSRQVFSEDTSTYKIVKKGQICYATNHIEEGSIGILVDFDEGLVSPMYTVFEINDDYDNEFVFHILKSDRYIELYK